MSLPPDHRFNLSPYDDCNGFAFVTNSYAFQVAAYNQTMKVAVINSDGTLGSWAGAPQGAPLNSASGQIILTKNRVYILGGWTPSTNSVSTCYTATVNPNGTLNAWSSFTAMPYAMANGAVIVVKNRVHVFDLNGNGTHICNAPVNADGTLGTWASTSFSPGFGGILFSTNSSTVKDVRVYANNSGTGLYYATVGSDGNLGTWTSTTALPSQFNWAYGANVVVSSNKVYVITAGYTFYAAINSDGTLGAWSTASNTLTYIRPTIITNAYIYTLGGFGSATMYSTPWSGGLNTYLSSTQG